MNTYRGPDRRRSSRPETGSPFDLTFSGAVVLTIVGFALALRHVAPVDTSGLDAEDYLALGTASILVLSMLLLVGQWRVNGALHALWAAGMCGLVAALVVVRCVASAEIVEHDALSALVLACGLLAVAVGLRAGRVPSVGPSMQRRDVAVAVAVAVTAVASATGVFAKLDVGVPGHDAAGEGLPGSVALIVGWVALTAALLHRGRRDGDWTAAWLGLLSLSLALAELAVLISAREDRVVPLAVVALVFVGATCAARGAARALQISLDAQARELDETRETMGMADDQAQSARAAAEERAHEARNALQAVGGAIQTLERYHERLDPTVRSKLADGIAFELERLQRLVDVDETSAPPTTFLVEDALMAVVEGARAQGLVVDVCVPDDLVAIGNPMATAEIVQNLLVNAQRHAAGVDVSLEAAEEAGRVLITVADGGPGVPHGEREAVFGRRQCGSDSMGQGFGLYVSRRLVRAQGGDLWVADRPGGGAVFGFDLAVASARRIDRGGARSERSRSDALDQVGDTADAG